MSRTTRIINVYHAGPGKFTVGHTLHFEERSHQCERDTTDYIHHLRAGAVHVHIDALPDGSFAASCEVQSGNSKIEGEAEG